MFGEYVAPGFPWDEARWNRDISAHYRMMIALRRERRVLQEGLFVQLYAEGDVFAFARMLADEVVIAIVNRGGEVEIDLDLTRVGLLDEPLQSLFENREVTVVGGVISLTLGACSSQVSSAHQAL